MKAKEKAALESLQELSTYLPKGAKVWACYRRTTRNGTSYVDFYVFQPRKDGTVDKAWLTWHIARALGLRFDERTECIRLPFMNMDQSFQVIYSLARKLHGDGYALIQEKI